ncbi:MAG: membrane protein insertase YidC [Pseudonocardiaceae bacterium]|nr:membrane protein insertase YidC [Pseudonocardiaceae bacterium]
MFDFILYPVSAILWLWHAVFGTLLGPDNGFAWALSVFFLVFTLRVLLLKPTISQLRSARKMSRIAPHIQRLRDEHKGDPQRQAQEMRRLQSEQGVNPLGSCLLALAQIPVFISLFTVLRNFHPHAHANYIFDKQGVDSFINADIFGAKLSNWISQPERELLLFGTDHAHMLAVGVPLMIIASVATFFSIRLSMRRQTEMSAANPQVATATKLLMYLAPVGVLVSGSFFPMPIGVLLYFLANNVWTLGQQHVLGNKIDREERRESPPERG